MVDCRCTGICLLCMLARLCNYMFVHVHVHVVFTFVYFIYHLFDNTAKMFIHIIMTWFRCMLACWSRFILLMMLVPSSSFVLGFSARLTSNSLLDCCFNFRCFCGCGQRFSGAYRRLQHISLVSGVPVHRINVLLAGADFHWFHLSLPFHCAVCRTVFDRCRLQWSSDLFVESLYFVKLEQIISEQVTIFPVLH